MDPITVTAAPGMKTFADLSSVHQAFKGLKIPRALPENAEATRIQWMYPPLVRTTTVNGKLEVAKIDYELQPSLGRGHVVLIFRFPGGSFIVDQGRLALYVNQRWDAAGPAQQVRLPSGRAAITREISDPNLPPTGVRVVGWIEPDKTRFSVYSFAPTVSIAQLISIADSV